MQHEEEQQNCREGRENYIAETHGGIALGIQHSMQASKSLQALTLLAG
jgi:hypothetical protein